MKQVINEPPLSFLYHDIDIDAQIESVIFKALSKKAADRYPSVTEFKTALLNIMNRLSDNNHTSMETTYSVAAFCDTLKSRFGYKGHFIESGLHVSPTCSVNYGAAGIAYMFYRMALLESVVGK